MHWAMVGVVPPEPDATQDEPLNVWPPWQEQVAPFQNWPPVQEPIHAPGLAAHKAPHPARDVLAEHWAIVTVLPPVPDVTQVPLASFSWPAGQAQKLPFQVCPPEHVVPLAQAFGDAAQSAAQPSSPGAVEHSPMVRVMHELPL